MIRLMDYLMNSSGDDSEDENGQIPARRQRRQRTFRPRINFIRLPTEIVSRFRLTDAHIDILTDRLEPLIRHKTTRNHALSPKEQVQFCLRYLGSGDHYRTIADAHGPVGSTLSRTLHRFVDVINRELYAEYVDWPTTRELARGIAEKFEEKAGIPGIFGCIDGTHVELERVPKDIEHQFVNRHGTHSINAMVVCGPNLR